MNTRTSSNSTCAALFSLGLFLTRVDASLFRKAEAGLHLYHECKEARFFNPKERPTTVAHLPLVYNSIRQCVGGFVNQIVPWRHLAGACVRFCSMARAILFVCYCKDLALTPCFVFWLPSA